MRFFPIRPIRRGLLNLKQAANPRSVYRLMGIGSVVCDEGEHRLTRTRKLLDLSAAGRVDSSSTRAGFAGVTKLNPAVEARPTNGRLGEEGWAGDGCADSHHHDVTRGGVV